MTDGAIHTDDDPTPPPLPVQIWAGYGIPHWLRLLVRNHFDVDRGCRLTAFRNTIACAITSTLGLIQLYRYGNRISNTRLSEPPLFVLGHWRSGTTFLHDLLCLDPRHTYPNSYQCWMPRHFLLSEAFVKRWFPIRTQRNFDEVEWTWDTPQEDEWAVTLMGQPSPYLKVAFPNRPTGDTGYLDLEGLSHRQREAWKRTLLRFLQALTFKKRGRLVLKSPTHTARIKVLLELFPAARFVHVVRNPYQVIPSTIKTFRVVFGGQGLQRPTGADLEEMVFDAYPRMFRRLEEGRALVAPERFHELRYEELTADPVGRLRETYERLGLGGFAEMQPRLEKYLAGLRNYRVGRHALPPRLRQRIAAVCGEVIRKYGYTAPDEDMAMKETIGDVGF